MGTKHRNHCPLCLWSRHLDGKTPGDRRSSCRAKMRPLGLIWRHPSLSGSSGDELMLVHLCTNCGSLSCNRIAGDDNPYSLTRLLADPVGLTPKITRQLTRRGISLLTSAHQCEVYTCLYGHNYLNWPK